MEQQEYKHHLPVKASNFQYHVKVNKIKKQLWLIIIFFCYNLFLIQCENVFKDLGICIDKLKVYSPIC